jgi:hypothetical protein
VIDGAKFGSVPGEIFKSKIAALKSDPRLKQVGRSNGHRPPLTRKRARNPEPRVGSQDHRRSFILE